MLCFCDGVFVLVNTDDWIHLCVHLEDDTQIPCWRRSGHRSKIVNPRDLTSRLAAGTGTTLNARTNKQTTRAHTHNTHMHRSPCPPKNNNINITLPKAPQQASLNLQLSPNLKNHGNTRSCELKSTISPAPQQNGDRETRNKKELEAAGRTSCVEVSLSIGRRRR